MRSTAILVLALCSCGTEELLPIRGEHESYVVSRERVPLTNTQARELGLDLNGDDAIDNQLGMVLSTLAAQNFLQSQIRTDGVIDRGGLIQLIDFQRPTEADGDAAAGFSLHVGKDPAPAACTDANDVVCRRHLDGSAVITLDRASDQPPLYCLRGDNGYECRGDRLPMLLGILGTPLQVEAIGFAPTEIELRGARVVFDDVGDGTLRGRIAGGVTEADLYGKLVPEFLQLIEADVRHDCLALDNPPTCGCVQDSAGKTYLAFFDTATKDCSVSFDELRYNSLIVSLFTPDVRIDGMDVLSLGVGFEAVPATIQ